MLGAGKGWGREGFQGRGVCQRRRKIRLSRGLGKGELAERVGDGWDWGRSAG